MHIPEIAAILTQVIQQLKMLLDLIEHVPTSPTADSFLENHELWHSRSKRCIDGF
jgi:hypothetical protein